MILNLDKDLNDLIAQNSKEAWEAAHASEKEDVELNEGEQKEDTKED